MMPVPRPLSTNKLQRCLVRASRCCQPLALQAWGDQSLYKDRLQARRQFSLKRRPRGSQNWTIRPLFASSSTTRMRTRSTSSQTCCKAAPCSRSSSIGSSLSLLCGALGPQRLSTGVRRGRLRTPKRSYAQGPGAR